MIKNVVNKITTTSSNSYLLDLAIIILLIPLSSTTILSRSLVPLFSSSPVQSTSIPFQFIITFISITLYLLIPRLKEIKKTTLLYLLGWNLISIEAIVRLFGSNFLGLGAVKGLYTARFAIEGLPMFLKWILLLNTLSKKHLTHLAFLPLFLLPLVGIDNFSKFSFLKLVPECYIYQIHGISFIILALTNEFPRPSNSSISSRKPALTKATSFPSIQSINLFLFTLLLILTTSFTSNHCLTSNLKPDTLPLLSLPTSFNRSSLPSHKILASQLSVTGWITVGEQEVINGGSSKTEGGEKISQVFRYLRCDHSILGGLWTGPSREIIIQRMIKEGVSPFTEIDEVEVVGTSETIYSTFILQEIIRLAKLKSNKKEPESALIIGLGVGISARALLSHGIDTTIVEIDPVVYNFAKTYFGVPSLPSNRVYISDARKFLDSDTSVYDYIIHDVFTGGTVPSHLFTLEFWESTKNRLKPQGGILAINFAGTISSISRSSNLVISTILTAFTYCRAFEDGKPSSDYRNLVILCSATNPIRFRTLLPEDYLPYPSPSIRRRVLETFKEFEFDLKGIDRSEILKDENVLELEIAQRSGALQHWYMMSSTLPDTSWAMY